MFSTTSVVYCLAVLDGIITQGRPGDEFVMIDGKRTYFDLGPTAAGAFGTVGNAAIRPTRPAQPGEPLIPLDACK